MTPSDQLGLNSNLLHPLVSTKPPNYAIIQEVNQADFEDTILPARATAQTYEKNAKVGLIVEQMFMYIISTPNFTPTPRLRAAVESGIAARGKIKGKRSITPQEEQAKALLEASGERLLGLLEVFEISRGLQPQEYKRKSPSHPELASFDSLSSVPDDLSSPEPSD